METWPYPKLPAIRDTLSNDPLSSVARTPMTSGRPRQRRRFTSDIMLQAVTWVMSAYQYKLFLAWFRYKISAGADQFTMDLAFGNDTNAVQVQACTCRFLEGNHHDEHVEGNWIVSATLEIENPPTMSETALNAAL